jgi:hypothetical protein
MNMGRRPGKCEQAVRIARPSPVISIRRREEIGSRLRQRRRRASRHRVIASRRAQRRGVVQPAGLCDSDGYAQTATCLARGCLQNSAENRSRHDVQRRSWGLRMGSPIERTKPRTSSCARRASKSTLSGSDKTRLVFGRTHGAEDPSHRGNVLGFLSGQVPVPGIGRGRYH